MGCMGSATRIVDGRLRLTTKQDQEREKKRKGKVNRRERKGQQEVNLTVQLLQVI